jgi:hypothetical protein
VKTVKHACVLQDNALDIRVSDAIEQLDELISDEGDGAAFFDKTFITQGMRTLVTEGMQRLASKSNQGVFHLKQAMGGGKTHLLVGFGLLAKHPGLRKKYCADISYGEEFAVAKVAAFNGRNSPDHYFWGEIAEQLGKAGLFTEFWTNGPKAPDERDWLQLFERGPILILLDEMPPYFHYLATQKVGAGTVADIATRAFANMLSAAGKKSNVAIVVSDLAAAYETGANLIHKALDSARQELGRQERAITPVDLTGNEVYEILRKRLFKKLPDKAVIQEIATAYGKVLAEASKAKHISRSAESIADEIVGTYPFHPRLKNLVALFKENEKFKQTRGLMELISRLLKSVWSREDSDVYLIGPQHFDLSIAEVRDKLVEISEMPDVVSKDVWDAGGAAHAQIIDYSVGNDAARQVSSLLLTASLSTAVNAIKGLTLEEVVECLVAPLQEPARFTAAFEALEDSAWYLHHTPEGRFYFDRQENLTKLLKSLAEGAPDNKVDELIRHRLTELFKPVRRSAYDEVLPLPKLDEVTDRIKRGRVLLIVSPDSKIPPEEVRKFFDSITQKNQICVLTGDKSEMASLEQAARKVFAAAQADKRIPKGHPQREEVESKQQSYDKDFLATVLNLFDKILFPRQSPGKPASLVGKPLDSQRDISKPYNGEDQVERTLTSDPLKLYLDVESKFDGIRDKAEDLLWPASQVDARWADVEDRYKEQAGMPWLPPRGLEKLRDLALGRGLWEDLGNGYVSKKPKKKSTSVQVTEESEPDDAGKIRLRVTPLNGGPAPRVHFAEDGSVTQSSPKLEETTLETTALRVQFLAVDPSGQYETGEPVVWTRKLRLRNELVEKGGKRTLSLFVAPRGDIRYTLDGSEPRHGTPYQGPFELPAGEVLVQMFAEADGLEAKEVFRFAAQGAKGPKIDPDKPVRIAAKRSSVRLDSRAGVFTGIKESKERGITFEVLTILIGQGTRAINIAINELQVDGGYLEKLLEAALTLLPPDTPVTLSFKKANFASGHDLERFKANVGVDVAPTDVEQ